MAVTINGNGVVTGLDSEGSSDLNTKLEAAGGLVMVTPTTIANTGGTATLTAGAVAVTGVTSISLNGCFTSAYENYKVVFKGTGTVAGTAGLLGRMRVAGTSASAASSYQVNGIVNNITTGPIRDYSLGTSAFIGNIGDVGGGISTDFLSPETVTTTAMLSLMHGNGSTNAYMGTYTNLHLTLASYDGFEYYPSSGTLTGTIRVYGYRNGI